MDQEKHFTPKEKTYGRPVQGAPSRENTSTIVARPSRDTSENLGRNSSDKGKNITEKPKCVAVRTPPAPPQPDILALTQDLPPTTNTQNILRVKNFIVDYLRKMLAHLEGRNATLLVQPVSPFSNVVRETPLHPGYRSTTDLYYHEILI